MAWIINSVQPVLVKATKTVAAAPSLWKASSLVAEKCHVLPGTTSRIVFSSLALFSSMGNLDKNDETVQEQDFPTNLCLKNLTVFWIGASALCIWFLFVHAPPFIVERKVYQDVPLAAHLGGAYTIYLTCLVNSLFTPSPFKYGKELHTTIGKVGMVFGFVSFALGFYCSWLRAVTPPLSFSIGITVGGIAQIISQIVGWRAIKKFQRYSKEEQEMLAEGDTKHDAEKLADLKDKKRASMMTHVYNMVALYMVACGAPALLRVTGMFLPEGMGVLGLVGSVVFLNLLVKPFGDTYLRKRYGSILP
jgi:hypothetical protein